jgi:hypothetical protein
MKSFIILKERPTPRWGNNSKFSDQLHGDSLKVVVISHIAFQFISVRPPNPETAEEKYIKVYLLFLVL